MAFTLSAHPGPYLLLVGTGEATATDVVALVDRAAAISKDAGYDRALIDLLSLTTSLSDEGHEVLCTHAPKLNDMKKVATVVAEASLQYLGWCCEARTLKTRTFTTLSEANAWLSDQH